MAAAPGARLARAAVAALVVVADPVIREATLDGDWGSKRSKQASAVVCSSSSARAARFSLKKKCGVGCWEMGNAEVGTDTERWRLPSSSPRRVWTKLLRRM